MLQSALPAVTLPLLRDLRSAASLASVSHFWSESVKVNAKSTISCAHLTTIQPFATGAGRAYFYQYQDSMCSIAYIKVPDNAGIDTMSV